MIQFILNNEDIRTDLPSGTTLLDFVRYEQNLKGTKIGCREGDCGACTILVGELMNDTVRYRAATSCLMPLANAAGKHVVTIEGVNPADGSLTPVQQAMLDESATQCGFCTVGFVMSLTGFCLQGAGLTAASTSEPASRIEAAISSVDGNICRCTGYKSIERAAAKVCEGLSNGPILTGRSSSSHDSCLRRSVDKQIVPEYFTGIAERLDAVKLGGEPRERRPQNTFVAGGTDLYVQSPDTMAEMDAAHLFYVPDLRDIRDLGDTIELGASVTVADMLDSPLIQAVFPRLYEHLKLVSSTPIRNMATLGGNFVNASPIGDMTIWFLALDAEIDLRIGSRGTNGPPRTVPLKSLYLDYKKLAKEPDEHISTIRFPKPTPDQHFNFEKVCKRTYLDIATVNTAIMLRCEALPGETWVPPALSLKPDSSSPVGAESKTWGGVKYNILEAHVSAGGVAPVPLYLNGTSAFLRGKAVDTRTITDAIEMMQSEISPITDVRGSSEYKRRLLAQLFRAHFVELFGV